jgi:hypothetical protein
MMPAASSHLEPGLSHVKRDGSEYGQCGQCSAPSLQKQTNFVLFLRLTGPGTFDKLFVHAG